MGNFYNFDLYKAIAENSVDKISVFNLEGIYEYTSPSVKNLLGYEPSELIGTSTFDKIHPDHLDRSLNYFEELKNNTLLPRICIPYKHKKGHYVELEISTHIINLDETEKLLTISRDFSDHVRSQKLINESKKRFENLVEQANDVFYQCNFEGFFEYANPKAIELTGYTEKEILSMHFTDMIREDYRERAIEFYKTQFENRKPNTYLEIPIITKHGESFWLGQNVQALLDGEWITGFQAFARDITKRKKIEESLYHSEARNFALLNAVPDTIIRINTSGMILDHKPGKNNDIFDQKKLDNTNILDLPLEENILTNILRKVKSAVNNKEIVLYEFKLNVNENITHYYEVRFVRSSHNEAICTVRNITNKKLGEATILNAKKRAEASSKSKEEFISVMSHEIRTPLNAIMGLTNLLMDYEYDENQSEMLDGIKYSSDNLLKIVNDILDYAKIESNKIVLEKTSFNLQDQLSGLIQASKAAAVDKGIKLELNLEKNLPTRLKGDPIRLNQILSNLVNNAVKFTKKGGVTISVSSIEQTVPFTLFQFEISDTGIGIPTDRTDSIFDSFTQASTDTTRKYGGTGLGLTITKQLVELQGGTIHVKSEMNKGTTFTVQLHLETSPDVKSSKPKKPLSKQELSGLSILVVEDNEMNLLVINKILGNWGANFKLCKNGEEGLTASKKEKFDIILMDLEMPIKDGYSTSLEIRSNAHNLNYTTPIIAISASYSKETRGNALKSGMHDYVSKPIDSNLLFNKIIQHTKGIKPTYNKANSTMNNQLVNLNYLIDSSLRDEDYIKKMIQMYLSNTPGYLQDFHRLLKENNLDELKRLAHKFKASITIMGIQKVTVLIEELESNIAHERNLDRLPNILQEMDEHCKESMTILEELLQSGKPICV